jgi:hypothetical protein
LNKKLEEAKAELKRLILIDKDALNMRTIGTNKCNSRAQGPIEKVINC